MNCCDVGGLSMGGSLEESVSSCSPEVYYYARREQSPIIFSTPSPGGTLNLIQQKLEGDFSHASTWIST